MGVAACVLFAVWFPSGIVMMYAGFPSVTAADRLGRSPTLEAAAVRVSPAEAYAAAGMPAPPEEIRLNTYDGRPIYRFRSAGAAREVYADTGELRGEASAVTRLRIASSWANRPAAEARVTEITEVDQWTVAGGLRTLRPLWKYSWPDGQDVYVAGRTGEVVQYTTSASRLAAYAGAIPHWLYFTPLRAHQKAWTRVVIWTSGAAAVAALIGLVVGLVRYSPRKRYRVGGVERCLPYRGQKRWHTWLGLVFGGAAVTWAFSGMLSMDPFPSPARDTSLDRAIGRALRGAAPIEAWEGRSPAEAIASVAPDRVRELQLIEIDGEPVYVAVLAAGTSRIVPRRGPPMAAVDTRRIVDIVGRAIGAGRAFDTWTADRYDAYYRDREGTLPLPVVVVQLEQMPRTRYYIDPASARIAGSYDPREWTERWLYHGLHSLDVPWLYGRRPLWDVVVIVLMCGGTMLSATSLALAWRVAGRALTRLDPRSGRNPQVRCGPARSSSLEVPAPTRVE